MFSFNFHFWLQVEINDLVHTLRLEKLQEDNVSWLQDKQT